MEKFVKLAGTTTLALAITPLCISIVAFAASFFIPVGTYLPQDLQALKQKLHFTNDKRPMISIWNDERPTEGREQTNYVAETVRA